MKRCAWAEGAPELGAYHDEEWGFPVADDRRLFERLSLEAFQSGLSWLTILRKRDGFRKAFAGFDPKKVAKFDTNKVEKLLEDPGIVRHRGKIEATIQNAAAVLAIARDEGSFARYLWWFEPTGAKALSKDLKRRGLVFVGETTVHSFLQAMGLVNDHHQGCFVWKQVETARRTFARPE